MADRQQVPTKTVPVGVKILSVLFYIGAVLGVISGILIIAGSGFIGSLLSSLMPPLGALSAVFVLLGVITICFGVLWFFIGRGLWRGRNWARIVVIVFAFLGALMAIGSMAMGGVSTGIVGLIIDLAIALYLLLSSSVKKAFA